MSESQNVCRLFTCVPAYLCLDSFRFRIFGRGIAFVTKRYMHPTNMENSENFSVDSNFTLEKGVFHNHFLRGFIFTLSLTNYVLSLYMLICYIIFLLTKKNTADIEECSCSLTISQPGAKSDSNESANEKFNMAENAKKISLKC